MEFVQVDNEVARQLPKSIDEIPEEKRGEYYDRVMNTVLVECKELRESMVNAINTIDDLPRGEKRERLCRLFDDQACKLVPLVDNRWLFHRRDDRCTDQSKIKEIKKEMKHWQGLIALCTQKLETYEKVADEFMPNIYRHVRKLKKIEDIWKVVDYLDEDYDYKTYVWDELEACKAKDKEEIEETGESFENVMEKVKEVFSDDHDRSSSVSYLGNVLTIARGTSYDLKLLLTRKLGRVSQV